MSFNIRQGGKSVIPVTLRNSKGYPIDLTGITDISTCFMTSAGPELPLDLIGAAIAIVGNPILGQLTISLTAAQTASLLPVAGATLELALTYGSSDPVKTAILNAYNVLLSVC